LQQCEQKDLQQHKEESTIANGLSLNLSKQQSNNEEQKLIRPTRRKDSIKQLILFNNNDNKIAHDEQLPEWFDGYSFKHINSKCVINQVSYKFSNTNILLYISLPDFVKGINWIDQTWLEIWRREKVKYPVVQYYWRTYAAGSFIDSHIDFGGRSVWNHVTSGIKEFHLIKPAPNFLRMYKFWYISVNQGAELFPDRFIPKGCEHIVWVCHSWISLSSSLGIQTAGVSGVAAAYHCLVWNESRKSLGVSASYVLASILCLLQSALRSSLALRASICVLEWRAFGLPFSSTLLFTTSY
jgi:hypothetical protein